MKRLYFIISFLVTSIITAQNGDIKKTKSYFFDYDVTYNTSSLIEKKAILILNNDLSESIFYIKKKPSTKNKKKFSENGNRIVTITNNKKIFNRRSYRKKLK